MAYAIKSVVLGCVLFGCILANPLIYTPPKYTPPIPLSEADILDELSEPDQLDQLPEVLPEDLVLQRPGDNSNQNEGIQFLSLLPPFGQPSGLAINPNNKLVLLHRSGRVWDEDSFDANNRFNKKLGPIPNTTIAIIDSDTGKIISEHVKNMLYMPHGLTIDSEGNHWVTDVGTHQVHKFHGKDMKLVMSLGEKLVPGSDNSHFCKPTDVAVASSGEFFIADGYCNSRIMKFNKDGKLITQFGHPNSANPPRIGEFFVPHSLALIEDLNLLCVADRENERVQCFSAGLESQSNNKHHRRAYVPTGKFITKAEGIGRIYAIRERDHYLFGVTDRGESQYEPQMFAINMNTGRANTFAKGIDNAHAIAISSSGDMFIGQMGPNQIVKLSPANDVTEIN